MDIKRATFHQEDCPFDFKIKMIRASLKYSSHNYFDELLAGGGPWGAAGLGD